jgi:DNA-binding MarR family transcriptional regulator
MSAAAELALTVEQQLRAVREVLRQPLASRVTQGALTGPQRSVMEALVRDGGLSLKALSAQVGLAHSTVSGIVDRLAQRGLVRRVIESNDRRQTRIVVTPRVQRFVRGVPALMRSPLVEALERARPTERRAIALGVATLARLVCPAVRLSQRAPRGPNHLTAAPTAPRGYG